MCAEGSQGCPDPSFAESLTLFASGVIRSTDSNQTDTSQISKSQDWPKGDSQVVVRTIIEVNQVTKLEP